jgi:hypothetical protein
LNRRSLERLELSVALELLERAAVIGERSNDLNDQVPTVAYCLVPNAYLIKSFLDGDETTRRRAALFNQ